MDDDKQKAESAKITDFVDETSSTLRHPALKLNDIELPVHANQIAKALRSRVRKPSLIATRILQWLEAVVPHSPFVIVSVSDSRDRCEVVASSSNLPSAYGAAFSVSPASLIAQASAHTQGACASISGRANRWALPWGSELTPGTSVMSCIALPQVDKNIVLVSFASDDQAEQTVNVMTALKGMLQSLESGPVLQSDDPVLLGQIARAKHEWERTVDALHDIVLLLREDGTVIRANRAIECWGLGQVASVRGASLHDVFHFNCKDPACRFDRILGCRWKELRRGERVEFRFHDPLLGRTVQVTFASADGDSRVGEGEPVASAVAVFADVTELVRAHERLEELNDSLEERVHERTQELHSLNTDLIAEINRREQAERALVNSRNELARLTTLLMHTQEAERRGLALELHDGLGQSLGALKYCIENSIELLRRNSTEAALTGLERGVREIQQALSETRSIATSLRPTILDDLGPIAALTWLCRRFDETYESIAVVLECELSDEDIPEEISLHVFRIAQEALNNVAKHADASTVLVSLRNRQHILQLVIRDDGKGFDPLAETAPGHIGIASMRRRASITGGEFSLKSDPDTSTQITIEWDLSAGLPLQGGETT